MDVHYLVASQEELKKYQDFYQKHQSQLADFQAFLRKHYALEELPQMLVFSNLVGATSIVRDITIPAYTNDTRLVMTPEIDVWKRIYLGQLEDYSNEDTSTLKEHYSRLSENHLLQIIGHELAHWSELFEDDFDDYHSFIWFEEGMVEYLSRQYFLTADEFQAEKNCNKALVDLYQKKYGWHSLNDFGKETYEGNYASIFYEYWRSFLTIDQLVSNLGSEKEVFSLYHQWLQINHSKPLLDWLVDNNFLENEF